MLHRLALSSSQAKSESAYSSIDVMLARCPLLNQGDGLSE